MPAALRRSRRKPAGVAGGSGSADQAAVLSLHAQVTGHFQQQTPRPTSSWSALHRPQMRPHNHSIQGAVLMGGYWLFAGSASAGGGAGSSHGPSHHPACSVRSAGRHSLPQDSRPACCHRQRWRRGRAMVEVQTVPTAMARTTAGWPPRIWRDCASPSGAGRRALSSSGSGCEHLP